MVSKAVIKAYADMIRPAKTYRVVGEMEHDHVEEKFTNIDKAIAAALDLMMFGYNVSVNEKYIGGTAMAEHQYPVNQGYFWKSRDKSGKPKKKTIGKFGGTTERQCNTCEHNQLITHGFFGRIHYCDAVQKQRGVVEIGDSMEAFYRHCNGDHYKKKTGRKNNDILTRPLATR